MLPKGAMGIPVSIPCHLIIQHNGVSYYPVSYTLSYDTGIIKHTATLHDMRQNSVVSVDLTTLEENNEQKQL